MDSANETIVAFANDDIAGVIHRYAPALADKGLVGCIKVAAITGVHKNIATKAVHEQVRDIRGVHIPKLRTVVEQQQITAGGNRPDTARAGEGRAQGARAIDAGAAVAVASDEGLGTS